MTLTKDDDEIIEETYYERNKQRNKENFHRKANLLKQAANGCWWVETYFKISEGRS